MKDLFKGTLMGIHCAAEIKFSSVLNLCREFFHQYEH